MDESDAIDVNWEGIVARVPAGTRLVLGLPRGVWGTPWADALQEHGELDVRVESVGELRDALAAGTVQCALVPVEVAVSIERGRVIPGLGVCVRGDGAGPWAVDDGGDGHGWGAGLMGVIESGDGVLRSFGVEPPMSGGSDLAGVWVETMGVPWVAAVWVAGLGAPIPKLRRILVVASRELGSHERIADSHGDVPADWIREQSEKNIYYTVGDVEMESIRVYLERAIEVGLVPDDARLRLC